MTESRRRHPLQAPLTHWGPFATGARAPQACLQQPACQCNWQSWGQTPHRNDASGAAPAAADQRSPRPFPPAQEEPCPRRQLCGALAAAVVTHSAPPSNIEPPTGVSAFALALAGDDPDGLVHLPVMERGRLLTSPLEPAGILPADSAAWAAYEAAAGCAASGQAALPLVWRGGSGSEPPAYPDWRALLDSESREGSPPPTALVTVPIVAPGGAAPLGAATFALQDAPSQQQVEELTHLGACLACSISHQTKNLWEVSAQYSDGREDCSSWRMMGRVWGSGLDWNVCGQLPVCTLDSLLRSTNHRHAACVHLPAAHTSHPCCRRSP